MHTMHWLSHDFSVKVADAKQTETNHIQILCAQAQDSTGGAYTHALRCRTWQPGLGARQ